MNDYEKLNAIHQKVSKLVEISKVSGELLRAYQNKTSQYQDMLSSIENLKEFTTDKQALENLQNQQDNIISTWIRFELDYANRLNE